MAGGDIRIIGVTMIGGVITITIMMMGIKDMAMMIQGIRNPSF